MSASETPATDRGRRKLRQGIVASNSMDKTAIVRVDRRTTHPKYHKTVTRSSRFHVHDEHNELQVGDRVRIAETRPMSKNKRWRLIDVIQRAR